MSGLLKTFERVTRGASCAICGHASWCLRERDGSGRAICARVSSSRRWGEAGWLHGVPFVFQTQQKYHVAESPDESRFRSIAATGRRNAEADWRTFSRLAAGLGVSVASLDALGVGLSSRGGSAWPMHDHLGRMVGIRRRVDGKKQAVAGSRNGLFVPDLPERDLVLVTEGESDCAAALSLGFFAIGRPGCQGGAEFLARWMQRRAGRDVAIVADADDAGRRGAAQLADALAPVCRTTRIVSPPRGAKDLRASLLAGADRDEFVRAFEQGEHVRPVLRVVVRRAR